MSLHISDAVIWDKTAGGISLYHTESGEFRTLNETGAQIWALIADDGEREPVIRKLTLLFGGGSAALGERIRADVNAFIGSMIEQGLLAETVPA
jgi:hypothetical protein